MAHGRLAESGRATSLRVVSASAPARSWPVLETKLHAPILRPQWVERPELVRALDKATAKLILVDAPAGYGKTTLLAQWRHKAAEDRLFAWVSLDPGDNDPHRLWWHVACALQRACPGPSADNLLRSLQAQAADISGTFIPSMANELAALAAPLVIVLDDYHVIKEPSCHQQLESLLLYVPPPVRRATG